MECFMIIKSFRIFENESSLYSEIGIEEYNSRQGYDDTAMSYTYERVSSLENNESSTLLKLLEGYVKSGKISRFELEGHGEFNFGWSKYNIFIQRATVPSSVNRKSAPIKMYITKVEDEWFLVSKRWGVDEKGKTEDAGCFKCDGLEGLVAFLKNDVK